MDKQAIIESLKTIARRYKFLADTTANPVHKHDYQTLTEAIKKLEGEDGNKQ